MNKRKNRGRRTLSLALAALMALSLGPAHIPAGTVYAEEADGGASDLPQPVDGDGVTIVSGEQVYVPDTAGLPDSEELFAGYVMRTFYGGRGIALLRNYGESALDGYDLSLYGKLKEKIEAIAASGGSTSFSVTLDEPITWATTAGGSDLEAEAGEKFREAIHLETILSCLLADCPYELYWYDKTEGTSFGYTIRSDGKQASIDTLTLTMTVSSEYRDGNNPLIVAPGTAQAAADAARTAQQIAEEHSGKSDYEKMLAFKDEICELVDYNHDAAAPGYGGGYGDPWQMIYVFDGDPATKVVCEGYSKAFQYLCDLSGLTCYTVTGMMSGGTGAGPHMWNIVTLGGKNYLVDVTNSDSGTAGQGGELFLAGYDSGSWEGQYNFTAGGGTISYDYDSDQRTLYGQEILTLSDSDYDPSAQEPQAQVSVSGPESGKVPYGTDPELRAVVTSPEGSAGSVTYQWYQYNESGEAEPVQGADQAVFTPRDLAPGNYRFHCVVVCGGEEITSSQITVTVEKAVLTPSITGTTSKVYDGTAAAAAGQGLSISLSGVVSGEEVSAAAESYTYNSKNVADADTITAEGITLSGPDSGNYQLSAASVSAAGTVTRRPVTVEGLSVEPSKVYDGTVSAAITGDGSIAGAVSGDTVQIQPGTAEYSDKNTGTAKTVTFSGFSLAGEDAPNYELTAQPAGTTAAITAKELTVAVKVADKLYDGTAEAQIESAELQGVVTGDVVELQNGTASFTDSETGTDIPVTFTEFTITGADAGNYTLVQPTGVTANIVGYTAQKGTDYTVNSNDWLREDFVVTAGAGRLLSTEIGAEDSGWTETLRASGETAEGRLVFYVKNTETGALSAAVTETYKIDRTAPEITGISDGGTYYGSAVFTVGDENLDAVYVDGQAAAASGGQYTIPADNGSHTVTASDLAGNSITFTISVYRTYTVTFVADGVTVGELTVNYGENVSADRFPQIPAKEGYTEFPPYWSPSGLENVSSDMTVTAVYTPDGAEGPSQPGAGGGDIPSKLVVENGLTVVPEGLKGIEGLDTPEGIRAALAAALTRLGVSAGSGNTALYNVTMMVDLNDGQGWIPAGPEHFSADGKLTVTLPYPEGTGKDTHKFTVAHMFTTDAFGRKPGDVETPAVTNTDSGLQFEVTGLSPIMVSWEAVKAQDVSQGAEQNNTPAKTAADTPRTGDTATAAYAALLCIGLLAAGFAVWAGKKAERKRQ